MAKSERRVRKRITTNAQVTGTKIWGCNNRRILQSFIIEKQHSGAPFINDSGSPPRVVHGKYCRLFPLPWSLTHATKTLNKLAFSVTHLHDPVGTI